MLEVKNLTVKFGNLAAAKDISFSVKEKQWLMVVGPNGSGKSTIVNAISQCVPYSGKVYFEGTDVSGLKPSQLAKNIGVLSQNHFISYGFSVEEVVRLGRYAYSRGIFSSGNEDSEKIDMALKITGMESFRRQSILTLSGGELQRAFLAQVFAQDPKLLILDEPTNHLDLVYQKQIFELIANWIKEGNRAVISVVHDLSLAMAYGTHALLLDNGTVVSSGKTNDVLTAENLKTVYAMDVYGWMQSLLAQWKL